jgi:hypothetical protein
MSAKDRTVDNPSLLCDLRSRIRHEMDKIYPNGYLLSYSLKPQEFEVFELALIKHLKKMFPNDDRQIPYVDEAFTKAGIENYMFYAIPVIMEDK